MVLNQRPDRQRSGRSSGVNAVQADVLKEETRQLNVALPVELHPPAEGRCGTGGDLGGGNGPPGRCSITLQMQISRIAVN